MKKLLVLVLVLSVLLSGCGILGVSQDEYDRLQSKYDDLMEEYEELEEEYDELKEKYEGPSGGDSAWDDAPAVDAPAADAPAADWPAADAPVEEAPAYGFSEEEVLDLMSVSQFYLLADWGGYAFAEIMNGSEFTISGTVDVTLYDDDGDVVDTNSWYLDTCAPGEYTLISCYSSEDFSWAEFDFSVYEEPYLRSVTEYLTWDSVTEEYGEVVTIYNTGDEVASGVLVQMLFYNGDELVDYNNYYYGDIAPGDSGDMDLFCYEEYDSYIIYYHAYSY